MAPAIKGGEPGSGANDVLTPAVGNFAASMGKVQVGVDEKNKSIVQAREYEELVISKIKDKDEGE